MGLSVSLKWSQFRLTDTNRSTQAITTTIIAIFLFKLKKNSQPNGKFSPSGGLIVLIFVKRMFQVTYTPQAVKTEIGVEYCFLGGVRLRVSV